MAQRRFEVVGEDAQNALPRSCFRIPLQSEAAVVEIMGDCITGGTYAQRGGQKKSHKHGESLHGTKLGRGNLRSMREGINLLESASPVMVSEKARQCWEDMQPGQSIVIVAHRSPDGDAVGAALGLHHHLKAMGIATNVVLPDRFPAFLDWMPGADGICFYEEETAAAAQLLDAADIIWCLDFNGLDRVGKMEDALRNAQGQKWVVDHHQMPDAFADRLLSDPACGSTCELLVDLIAGWGQSDSLSNEAMACLYVGIMTDTGSFRFPSVTAHTHAVLAHFLSRGLDHAAIHQNTFDEQSLNRVQLQGFAMSERLHVFSEYGLAVVAIERGDLDRFHYESGDTEGLVNKVLGLAGVRVAIMAREAEPGLIKLSLRSVGDFSVRDLAAAEFDGGGHKNAAGGIVKGKTIPEFIAFVNTRLSDWIDVS